MILKPSSTPGTEPDGEEWIFDARLITKAGGCHPPTPPNKKRTTEPSTPPDQRRQPLASPPQGTRTEAVSGAFRADLR